MSVFNRIAGTEEPKIAVWPIMMDITRVMDQRFTFAELATKYELTAPEQAEMAEYMTAIGGVIQSEAGIRINLSWPQDSAMRDARVSVDAVLRYALLQAEQGTLTESEFRQQLGLP